MLEGFKPRKGLCRSCLWVFGLCAGCTLQLTRSKFGTLTPDTPKRALYIDRSCNVAARLDTNNMLPPTIHVQGM